MSTIEISERVKLHSNWIAAHDDLFGSCIRVAGKELPGLPTIYVYAMNEVFDSKINQKVLCSFQLEKNQVITIGG